MHLLDHDLNPDCDPDNLAPCKGDIIDQTNLIKEVLLNKSQKAC